MRCNLSLPNAAIDRIIACFGNGGSAVTKPRPYGRNKLSEKFLRIFCAQVKGMHTAEGKPRPLGVAAKSDLVHHRIENAESAQDTLVLAPSNLQFVSINERIFPALFGEPRTAYGRHDDVFRERAVPYEIADRVEIFVQQPHVLFEHVRQIVKRDLGNTALADYVKGVCDPGLNLGLRRNDVFSDVLRDGEPQFAQARPQVFQFSG